MRAMIRAGIVVITCAPFAQPQQNLVFEVASVKLSGPNSVRNFDGGPGTREPGRMTCTKASMNDLLAEAYGIEYFQISGPGWFSS